MLTPYGIQRKVLNLVYRWGSQEHPGNVLLRRKDSPIWELQALSSSIPPGRWRSQSQALHRLARRGQGAWCYTSPVSDTIPGVKVLSTAQALKFLLSVTPPLPWARPSSPAPILLKPSSHPFEGEQHAHPSPPVPPGAGGWGLGTRNWELGRAKRPE